MKRTLSWFVILAVIVGGVWYFSTKTAQAPMNGNTDTAMEKLPPPNPLVEVIQLAAPALSSTIKSPLSIAGQARGTWYFEASFPIELQDANGVVIGTTSGQAQGEWMTENWVPFTATLTFPAQPAGSTGKLVLKKDNPSGEPQNDASLIVPVQF